MSLSHGLGSHHLTLASDLSSASAAQVVNSIVDAGVAHMAASSNPNLLSHLENTSEHTNSVIHFLNTTNNPNSFQTNSTQNVLANCTPSLASSPSQLTQTKPLETLEHGNRSGIGLLQTQQSGGESSNSATFLNNENHSHVNDTSPTEKIETSKVGSLENGGGGHSPKYISL